MKEMEVFPDQLEIEDPCKLGSASFLFFGGKRADDWGEKSFCRGRDRWNHGRKWKKGEEDDFRESFCWFNPLDI
ncbi:hypothetical protein L6452_39331 [Arctium lappa]|uniref:Uncharacterized protein n=1 Tax=Arctium lappa TaxID=4217 RepID=A0ACB8XRH6_ARCLA|nr:hypothetical protein L6452_39331 [Arctium lappa]